MRGECLQVVFFFFFLIYLPWVRCSALEPLITSWGRMGGQVVAHPNTAMLGERMHPLRCLNKSIQFQNELQFPLFCFNFMFDKEMPCGRATSVSQKTFLKIVCHFSLLGCKKWKQVVSFSPKAVNYTLNFSSQQNRSFKKCFINSATETTIYTFKMSRYCYFQDMASFKNIIDSFLLISTITL